MQALPWYHLILSECSFAAWLILYLLQVPGAARVCLLMLTIHQYNITPKSLTFSLLPITNFTSNTFRGAKNWNTLTDILQNWNTLLLVTVILKRPNDFSNKDEMLATQNYIKINIKQMTCFTKSFTSSNKMASCQIIFQSSKIMHSLWSSTRKDPKVKHTTTDSGHSKKNKEHYSTSSLLLYLHLYPMDLTANFTSSSTLFPSLFLLSSLYRSALCHWWSLCSKSNPSLIQ